MRIVYLLLTLWIMTTISFNSHAKKKKVQVRKVSHSIHHVRKPIRRPVSRHVRHARQPIHPTIPRITHPATLYGKTQLADALNRVIRVGQANANLSVYVKSMQNGETLYSHNINHPLTPASTLKILTAEAALIYLGSNYKFTTQILTDAKKIKNGILQGNLYVVLSGDPSLTYEDLGELLRYLPEQQIYGIAGNVYIDQTAYDQLYYGPGWVSKDKSYCYGAPIGASIINHNCLPFRLMPPTASTRSIQLARRKNVCSLSLSSDLSNLLTIDGCMTKNSNITYVVTDVPQYTRTLIKSLLQRHAVTVYGQVGFKPAPNHLSLMSRHSSKSLDLLIHDMLKKSNNIIAGAIFKKLGQLYTGRPGSWENGSLAVSNILAKHAGMSASGLRILDGSGLSKDNLATSQQMMQILDFAYHHAAHNFMQSLPISGVDGTLKNRMKHIPRKIRAKTGTISGVVSLAGYASTLDKEQLAFVIMINGNKNMGWRYKSLEDQIVTLLTKYKKIGNATNFI